jgi:two-component sensor histidine kinase
MSNKLTKDNSDKLEQLLLKENYLEVINSFATILFEAQTIDEIVWTVAEHAIAKLNYYDCVIYLYDERQNKLIQSAAYGPKNPAPNQIWSPIKITPGEGVVGAVFESGIGEIVNDTSKDPRYIVDDAARLSEISVPLWYKGEIIGVIDSEHPIRNFFSELDFSMLTTVAAMVSAKIVQARATNELKEYQQNLEKLISEKTGELEQINKSLLLKNHEKEILLKEVHHRVKNNMQIMISLLNIQSNSTESKNEKIILEDFQNRIRSMSLIHERLYLEKDVSNISLDNYIYELITSLSTSFRQQEHLEMYFDLAQIHINIDTAIPLGLMLNEMMTNALQHGIIDLKNGKISIVMSESEGIINLTFSDNGPGFDYENYKGESFGLELIEILSSQIGGELNYIRSSGSHFNIEFNS